MYRLCFLNNKGGVGKTSSAYQIAAILADRGLRTLLVDLDGQGNLSSTALANSDAADATIYDVFYHGADPASAVRPVQYAARGCRNASEHGLFCMSGDSRMYEDSAFDVAQSALDVLNAYFETYDAVIVDMPPSRLNAASVGCRLAPNIVVPMSSSDLYAIDGYSALEQAVADTGTKAKIIGVFATLYQKRTVNDFVCDSMQEAVGDLLFDTRIPYSSQVQISAINGRPLIVGASSEKATHAFAALTDEIIERLS